MRRLFLLFVTLAIGAGLGLGSAWLALAQNLRFGAVKIGVWTNHPRASSLDADPYSRASLARRGALPLANGEGVSYIAWHDETGAPLVGRCVYVLSGRLPPARAWTMIAYDLAGRIPRTIAGRSLLGSAEVLREADGSVTMRISSRAEPGNWLPVAEAEPFALVLNLYDTPVSAIGGAIDPTLLPILRREACS